MKKEMLITAIVFFSVGFLLGYVFDAQRRREPRPPVTATSAPPSPDQMAGLPAGHPPINIDSAVEALREKAAESPQDPAPPLQIANLLYDHQRFQEAVEWYEKALSLDPRNVNARTDLGTCYFNLGRPEEALKEYRKSLDVDPWHEPTIFNTILVNLQGKRHVARARAAWEKLHRLNPKYPGLDRLKQNLDSAGADDSSPSKRG